MCNKMRSKSPNTGLPQMLGAPTDNGCTTTKPPLLMGQQPKPFVGLNASLILKLPISHF